MSISGKFITATIGAVLIRGVQSWTAEDSSQELDGATAEDLGFEHPDDGLAVLSVSMDLVVDITTGSLIPISRGTLINNLNLFANATAAQPIYNVPTFKVFKSTPKGEIGGRFTYAVQGKSIGPYTLGNPN